MRYSEKLHSTAKLLGAASFVLGLMALPAGAQDVKPSAIVSPEVATPVAKPKPVGVYKPYFVEFRARSAASYGHMYVLYGQVNGNKEIIKSNIAGLHPAGDRNDCENCSVVSWTIGHLIPVPAETGASDGDLEEKYVSARYRVMMDAAEYKRVSAYIAKLRADNPQWHALWNNCVGFGRNVAEFMNLKVPGFIWLEPKDFVEQLQAANGGGPKQGPLKDAGGFASARPAAAKPVATPVSNPAPAGTPPVPAKPKKQPVASSSAPATASATAVRSTPN
jgi:hypothetical protein